MYNIMVLIALAAILAMARRGKGRRSPNWRRYMSGTLDLQVGMSTLAAKTLTTGALVSDLVTDTTRVSSIKCTYSIGNLTSGVNVGPFVFGVAHSDYTDGEIEGWLETTGSWAQGDMITKEVRRRRIRQIGVIDNILGGPTATQSYGDGRLQSTKLNWLLAEGQGLKFWVYNAGSAAVVTTAPNYNIYGYANLWVV